MEVLVLFVVVGLAWGLAMTFRGYRGVAMMSDGQSPWARCAALASSRCQFRLARSATSRPLVSMGGELAIYSAGVALTTPLSRLERRYESISSNDFVEGRGSVTIRTDDASVAIRGLDARTIAVPRERWHG